MPLFFSNPKNYKTNTGKHIKTLFDIRLIPKALLS